jgi:hypothetical protein
MNKRTDKNKVSKEKFIDLMTRFKETQDAEAEVHIAMKKLSPYFGGFYLSKCDDLMLECIKLAMEDEYDWISYFVYDLQWGKNPNKLYATDKFGKKIRLKTFGDLYQILIGKI